ncbi:hypothetical protein AURDEDRAFT_88319 [Auricularia subglabra TFB-10046 SS5]|nr:hypothetical protein AURDEDRAFT_88319 [Auricularia subglabra TFB-10046 SS5]
MSLFPGFAHVDAFGADDEYESGEEVGFVTLDLGHVEPQLVPQTSSYRLAGLDTPTPFLQLSGATFKGEHTQLLGSEILFTNGRDEANPNKRFVVPVATTSTRIRFSEVLVRPPPEPGELATAEELQEDALTAAQKQLIRRRKRASQIFRKAGDKPRRRRRRRSEIEADEEAAAAVKKKGKKKKEIETTDDDAEWSEDQQSVEDDPADPEPMVVDEEPVAGSSRLPADESG